jgi:drug/metabolite transporter (DMT)-like permease
MEPPMFQLVIYSYYKGKRRKKALFLRKTQISLLNRYFAIYFSLHLQFPGGLNPLHSINKPAVPIPILIFIAIVAISFSAIFVKWSTAPAAVVAMYRLLITSAGMLPFLFAYRHELTHVQVSDWIKLLISGISLGFHFLFWMDSLRFTTVASSTAILTLEPVFVMLGSLWMFKQGLSRAAFISMIIAICGAILIGWGDFQFSGTAFKGDLLSFLGTLCIVIHILLGKSLRAHMSAFVYSFFVFLFAGIVMAVYNLINGYSFTAYSANEWGIFILLAIVPTVFGHYLFNWLLKYMKATSVSMSVLGEPLGATILAYFLLGEMITPVQIAAGCLLLVGVALFIRSNHKPLAHPANSSLIS